MSKYLQILTMVLIVIGYSLHQQLSGSKVKNSKKFVENDQEFSCDRRMENEIDKSLTRLIVLGQRNLKFPTNEQQVRPYCNLALRTFDLSEAYANKCVPEFGKHTMKVFMHVIGVELKGVCKAGKISKRAKELLTAAPCANSGLKNWQKCYQELINKLTGALNAPLKMRIPMGCCNFHQFIQCMTDEAEEVKECTQKTVDYLTKYVHKIFDPIILILCNEYSEPSDRCDKLVRNTPNRTKTQRKYHSFVRPLINIGMSLSNDESFTEELVPNIQKKIKQ